MNEMENVNYDNSENVLREKFSEAPTIDTNLWENIEKALNESDKRKRFILFRNLTLVLLVIGFSFSYFFYKLSNEKKFANIKENDNETFRKSQDAWTISFSQYRNGDERIVKNGKKSLNRLQNHVQVHNSKLKNQLLVCLLNGSL